MKIIIIEGMDNTGKSTMILELVNYLVSIKGILESRIYINHLVKPNGDTNIERATNIDLSNFNLATFLLDNQFSQKYDYVILDRAWYSEYVYGQLYRERDNMEVLHRIQFLERYLSVNYFSYYDSFCLYIFLADNPEFFIKHEDGQSLSIGDDQRNLIIKEMNLFTNILYNTNLRNVHAIIVNNGSEYLPKEEILKKITDTIK